MCRDHVVVGTACRAFQVPSTTASYNPSIRAVRMKHPKAYIVHPHAGSVLGLCESENWGDDEWHLRMLRHAVLEDERGFRGTGDSSRGPCCGRVVLPSACCTPACITNEGLRKEKISWEDAADVRDLCRQESPFQPGDHVMALGFRDYVI